jgi:mono/diheme cytochrome c family protein
VLGISTAQLNSSLLYPSSGVTDNQLRTLDHIGLIAGGLPNTPENLPKQVNPHDLAEPVNARARSYLATNCSQCHRSGGGAPGSMNLQLETTNEGMNAIYATPAGGTLGIADAFLVAPSNPAKSILLERIKRLDTHRMPPIGSTRLDDAGIALIETWINSLPAGASWAVY